MKSVFNEEKAFFIYLFFFIFYFETIVVRWHMGVIRNAMVVGLILFGIMKYLIFSFSCSGTKVKRDVKFHHPKSAESR